MRFSHSLDRALQKPRRKSFNALYKLPSLLLPEKDKVEMVWMKKKMMPQQWKS